MTTITVPRELLNQALDALNCAYSEKYDGSKFHGAKAAIRAALEAPATTPDDRVKELEAIIDKLETEIARRHGIGGELLIARRERDELREDNERLRAAPATAPEQPAWQDAPNVPGLWWVAGTAGIFHIDEAALPIYKGSAHRWFGPIPEDKQ